MLIDEIDTLMKFRQDDVGDEGQDEEDVGDGAADWVGDTGDARLEQNKYLKGEKY